MSGAEDPAAPRGVSLGLGLVSLGRVWGVAQGRPPDEAQAFALLDAAATLGIRLFDTAPAYGASEAVLGRWLAGAGRAADRIAIATKFGEHWVEEGGTTVVDHAADALRRSLDTSFARLGRIDILQVHKATAEVVAADAVHDVLGEARARGVRSFGASVSDLAAARAVCATGRFDWLQFPYNADQTGLRPAFGLLAAHAMAGMVNRPLAMGRLADVPDADKGEALRRAFAAAREPLRRGVVLTGTRSAAHLAQSVAAWTASQTPAPHA